jgi:LysM domain
MRVYVKTTTWFALGTLLLSLTSCCCRRGNWMYESVIATPELQLEEVRHEIASMQYRQEDAHTGLVLLEERVEEQQVVSQTQVELLQSQLLALHRKVQELEETQGRSLTDIRELGRYAKESAITLTDVQSQQREIERGLTTDIHHLKGAMESIVSASGDSDGLTYKVVAGDTLERIARRHETSVAAIKKLNNLANDRIFVGQTLRLP